jgi:rubrerythrin
MMLRRFSGPPLKVKPVMHMATWSIWSRLAIRHRPPIGRSRDNLKAAIAGETHEYTDMYPGMAKGARDEGFDEIADWFETLAKAERSHANRFQKALDALTD